MTMLGKRIGLFTALSVVVMLAIPAHAQVRTRDHSKKPTRKVKPRPVKPKGVSPVKVARWGPQSGDIGTAITVEGSFDGRTRLLFGGRTVRKATISRTKVSFQVPRRTGDGSIVLRHPDMASDLVVGTFQVIEPPVLKRFAPRQGVVGTRVELRGNGFQVGDRVLMNGRDAKVINFAPSRLVIQIPVGATTDYLTVTRAGGGESRSSTQFVVQLPAPTIAGFSPASGPEGVRVRLTGANFTGSDKVFFGRRPATVLASAGTWLDVEVPAKAGGDQFFMVRNANGQATSAVRFMVERPPRLARFAPNYGPTGQRVEIYGANFAASDVVTLNGTRLKILQLRATQISVEIPPGATSGLIMLERGTLRSGNSVPFEVVKPPSIHSFAPAGGEPGSRVTISGTELSRDTDVYLGSQKLKLIEWRANSVVVEIPRRARDEFFIVRTRGGEARSSTKFAVQIYSRLTAVSPSSGPVGTRVTFTGANFTTADRFLLGGQELPVVEFRANRVITEIPAGATTGPIGWESYGRVTRSRYTFTVLEPAVVADLTPRSGPAGTKVSVRGNHFTRSTRVYWGASKPLRIVGSRLPTELTVEIPRRATGTEYLWVEESGSRVRSPHAFEVILPPEVTSFTPDRGMPGTEVTVTGAYFTAGAQVLLGTAPAEIVRRAGTTSIVVRIPSGTRPGRLNLFVQDGGATARSRGKFTVLPQSVITRITPASGKAGDQVDLYGKNFGSGAKVYFGSTECKIIRYGRRGDLLTVRMPAGLSGSNYFVVEQQGHRAQSPTKFTITAGDNTPPPKTRRRGR